MRWRRGRERELRKLRGFSRCRCARARVAATPQAETEVIIPQRRPVVKFKSGKILKAKLKKLDLGLLANKGGEVPPPPGTLSGLHALFPVPARIPGVSIPEALGAPESSFRIWRQPR